MEGLRCGGERRLEVSQMVDYMSPLEACRGSKVSRLRHAWGYRTARPSIRRISDPVIPSLRDAIQVFSVAAIRCLSAALPESDSLPRKGVPRYQSLPPDRGYLSLEYVVDWQMVVQSQWRLLEQLPELGSVLQAISHD